VYSVTSDASTNVSFQGPPQRPARYDQPSPSDSFEVLLDSNTAANTGNDPDLNVAAARRLTTPIRRYVGERGQHATA